MPLPVSDQAERLGRAIKTLLTAAGHSRSEISDVTGLSIPYLSEIIRGTKEAPPRTIQQIAECFGFSIAELYAFADALPSLRRGPAGLLEEVQHRRYTERRHVPDPEWNPDLKDWAMRTTPRRGVVPGSHSEQAHRLEVEGTEPDTDYGPPSVLDPDSPEYRYWDTLSDEARAAYVRLAREKSDPPAGVPSLLALNLSSLNEIVTEIVQALADDGVSDAAFANVTRNSLREHSWSLGFEFQGQREPALRNKS